MPVLLPFFWVSRLIRLCFSRKKDILPEMNKIYMVSKENIDDYQTALNYVGLDFNFDEN